MNSRTVTLVVVALLICGATCRSAHCEAPAKPPRNVIAQFGDAVPDNNCLNAIATAYSPEGDTFALLCEREEANLYRVELRSSANCKLIWKTDYRDESKGNWRLNFEQRWAAEFVRFSADGQRIFTLHGILATHDGVQRAYSLSDKVVVAVAPDGKHGLTSMSDGSLQLVTLPDGKIIREVVHRRSVSEKKPAEEDEKEQVGPDGIKYDKPPPPKPARCSARFLNTASFVVCGEGAVAVYNTKDGRKKFQREYEDQYREVSAVPTDDGKQLVVRPEYRALEVIDAAKGTLIAKIEPPAEHGYVTKNYAASREPWLVAESGREKRLHLLNLSKLTWVKVLPAKAQGRSMAVSPDGRRLIVCGMQPDGSTWQAWDVSSEQPVVLRRGPQAPFQKLLATSSGRRLAARSGDEWFFYDLPDGRRSGPIDASDLVAISADGKLVAEYFIGTGLNILDADTGRSTTFRAPVRKGSSHGIALDSSLATAFLFESGQFKKLDVRSRTSEILDDRIKSDRGWIQELCISPDGALLAASINGERPTSGRTIEIWDVKSKEMLGKVVAPPPVYPARMLGDPIPISYSHVEFLGNSNIVAARTYQTVDVWNVSRKNRTHQIRLYDDPLHKRSLQFLADGKYYLRHDAKSLELFELATAASCFVWRFGGEPTADGAETPRKPEHGGNSISALLPLRDSRAAAIGVTEGAPLWIWSLDPEPSSEKPAPLRAAQSELLWHDLANGDAKVGYTALWGFARTGDYGVAALKSLLSPAKPAAAAPFKEQIAKLSSSDFAEREAATAKLVEMGESINTHIANTLTTVTDAEVRSRLLTVQRKLAEAGDAPRGSLLRQVRAVSALERIGTDAAVNYLTELSKGDPHARLTLEVRDALVRLKAIARR